MLSDLMALSRHSAAGPAAGFAYQFERALQYLANSSAGSLVGIETDDDVAVRGADETQILEQDKHSIQKDAEPFGNRSKDLWNTLSTWVAALDSGEVTAGKTLFMMVTDKTLPDGIAQKIGRATSEEAIDTCIAALETEAISPPDGIKSLVDRVMRPGSRPNLRKLIDRCRPRWFGSRSGRRPPKGNHRTSPVAGMVWVQCRLHSGRTFGLDTPGGTIELAAETTGLDQTRSLREPASRDHRRFGRDGSAKNEPSISFPSAKTKSGAKRESRFVKQLHLITDDDSVVDTSIREFIRCNIEKARLSAEGNITDDDWLTFEYTCYPDGIRFAHASLECGREHRRKTLASRSSPTPLRPTARSSLAAIPSKSISLPEPIIGWRNC